MAGLLNVVFVHFGALPKPPPGPFANFGLCSFFLFPVDCGTRILLDWRNRKGERPVTKQKRLTLPKINAALAGMGLPERLFAGKGYFYFAEGNACRWHSTMVIVGAASSLTMEQWVHEYEVLGRASIFEAHPVENHIQLVARMAYSRPGARAELAGIEFERTESGVLVDDDLVPLDELTDYLDALFHYDALDAKAE